MTDQKLKDPNNPSGPVDIGQGDDTWTVTVDRNLCIGAGTCVAIAPNTFVMDEDAKALILETADQDGKEVILDAAKGCPVAAIIIKNKKGELVYPK
jgi:ferredoxin